MHTDSALDKEVKVKIKKVEELLSTTKLENKPGAIIYSANSTLVKGDFYFLGQNPGGNDEDKYGEDTILNQLVNSGEHNEYTEGNWSGPYGRMHQNNIKEMFKDLDIDIDKTFSTNLNFVRSGHTGKYPGGDEMFNRHVSILWPIHEYFLSIVQPKVIISNGDKARKIISKNYLLDKNNYDEVELDKLYRSRKQKCKSQDGVLTIYDKKLRVRIVSIFHLSKWEYKDYKKGVGWLRSKINQAIG